MTTDVKVLTETDLSLFEDLLAIFQDVFELPKEKAPDRNHLQTILADKDCIVIVATVNGQTVGGLTAYILPNYFSAKPMAYIYDVGVRTDYQRQGIGKKVMAFFLNHCSTSGIAEAFVQADVEDDDAITFYRQLTAINPIHAVQFTFNGNHTADQ